MVVSRETYTCAACGQTYDKIRPDEEALAEMRHAYGDVPPDQVRVICDTCHQRFLRWLAQQPKN